MREPGHHRGAGPPLPRIRSRNAPPGLRRPQEPLHRRDASVRRARVRRAPNRRRRRHRRPPTVRATHICHSSLRLRYWSHLLFTPIFFMAMSLLLLALPAARGNTGSSSSLPRAPTSTTSASSSPGGRQTRRRRPSRSSTSSSGSSPTKGISSALESSVATLQFRYLRSSRGLN